MKIYIKGASNVDNTYFILLLMYIFFLYSLLKDTKATGLGKKANLYVFPGELGDTDEKVLLWKFYKITICSSWENWA